MSTCDQRSTETQVWMTSTFIQGHSCIRNQSATVILLHTSQVLNWFGENVVCCHNLLVYWSSRSIYNNCTQSVFKGENSSYLVDFIYNTPHWFVYRCFWTNLFQTWYRTGFDKPCSLISLWMTLTFTQDHKLLRQLDFVQSFYNKV